ncbi:MAG: gliding motility-associated C-terminal domain-containing protein [Bacteroidetes bacterium]|nr:gliding motility-associated C-terminal domain-containing protein [Bacteroidota bacterium]
MFFFLHPFGAPIVIGGGASQPVFINEFHYDNSGADVNEGVEIAGPAGTDLACYQVWFYNQNDSLFYDTLNLFGIIDDEGCGYGAVWFPNASIQNGPDGIALVNACNCGGVCDSTDVVQFLSYEGVFMALDGPAAGMVSVDFGVDEDPAPAAGNSLQLTGSGINYSNFSWSPPAAASAGVVNTGQIFGGGIVADRLNFISYPSICTEKSDTFSLTVCGTDSAGNVSSAYSGTVSLTQISGPGNISGTLSIATASCCVRFTDLTADSAGIYIVTASDGTNLNDTLILYFADTCGKCFEINSILVEACEPIPGTEGANEMVRFSVGPDSLDADDLYIDWPNNSWLGVCQDSVTAAIVDSINNMISYGGSVSEPVNGILPPGATVIMVTSTAFDWDSHNWTYLNYDIYMIFQCAGNTQGHFKNNEGCPCGSRTLIMTFAGACSDTVVYTVDSLPNGGNGGDGDAVIYDAAGNPAYGNNQCLPPIFPFSLNLFMASQPVSCNGSCDGIASLFHTGGVKPYTYFWNDPAAQTDSMATGLCSGIYSVTVTDLLGTSATDSAVVTEPAQLSVNISSVSNLSCYGDSTGNASVNSFGGTGTYTYNWDNGTGTDTLQGVSAGIYTITVTDSNGCTATTSALITEPPQLLITTDSIKDVTCAGDSTGFASVVATGGTSGYAFSWNTGNSGLSISGLAGGSYTATVTDTNGCSASTVISIAEPAPLASAIISKTDISCAGYCNGTATATGGGGTFPYTYLWDNLQDSSTSTGLCPGNFTVTVTDFNDCQASTTVTITEPVPIQIIMTVANISCNSVCDGQITLLPGPTGGVPPYSFTWFPPGTGTGPTIFDLCTGTYSVTITDIIGCTASDSASITEPDPLVLSVGSAPASCGFNDGQAWVTVSGSIPPYSYQWNDSAMQTNDTASGLFAGNYTVIITDSNSCTDSASVVVNNADAPVISVDSLKNISCFDFSDGAIYISVNSGIPPFTYNWSNSFTVQDPLFIPAGSYSVTVTDSLGCLDFETTALTQPSQIIVNAIASICQGDTIFLGGGWQISGGNYTDTLSAITGCDSIVITLLSVNPVPQAAFSSDITSGCWPVTVQFYDSSKITSGIISQWNWFFDIGIAIVWISQQNLVMDYSQPGNFEVTIEVVSDKGCSDLLTVPGYISVFPYPYADFTATPQPAFISDPEIIFNNVSVLSASSFWNFGDGDTSLLDNPVHLYTDTGSFTVTLIVASQDGCTDTAKKLVTIYPEPKQPVPIAIGSALNIPTSFSPNGDGVNDSWILRGIENYPDATVEIFNRWGSKVFSSEKGYPEPWDGKYGGNKVPAATYYYIITIDDTRKNLTGTVTVVW